MSYQARWKLVGAVCMGLLFVAGGLTMVVGRSERPTPHRDHRSQTGSRPSQTTPSPTTLPSSRSAWRPVAPATTVPAATPVQQQYNEVFEQGLSSPPNRAEMGKVSSLSLPPPRVTGGWPELAPAYTPGGWASEFVSGLLDIDFSRQSRAWLARWLVAEEAPDLMPGIPAPARYGWLLATVLDPGLVQGSKSPIPSAAQWSRDGSAAVRWSVGDLLVQVDPQWQSMVAAGWRPTDLYASVEDVSGVLTVTQGVSVAHSSFSLEVQLGSAHWHTGYGTVLVGEMS